MIIVEIPTKPAVNRYLRTLFGNMIWMNSNSTIGKYFIELLGEPCKHQDTKFKGYSCRTRLRIKYDVLMRSGSAMTDTNIMRFNSFVEDEYYKELCAFVDGATESKGIAVSTAIRRFLKKNGFGEDELSEETARKYYDRKAAVKMSNSEAA